MSSRQVLRQDNHVSLGIGYLLLNTDVGLETGYFECWTGGWILKVLETEIDGCLLCWRLDTTAMECGYLRWTLCVEWKVSYQFIVYIDGGVFIYSVNSCNVNRKLVNNSSWCMQLIGNGAAV